MSLQFDPKKLKFDPKTLKEVYDEEIRHFGIRENGMNRVKRLFNYVDTIIGNGQNQLTEEQLLAVIHETNILTSADVVTFCLQSYYDPPENEVTESLYSSGIERTVALFDSIPCEPSHPTHEGETKAEYIDNVMFPCFLKYMMPKKYEPKDVYRCIIRFGCMFNPRSNVIVKLFNNLSNGYLLQSVNLEEGSEHGFGDRNEFTGEGNIIKFSSKNYSQITNPSAFSHVGGQHFMLTIDYGNIMKLDARPFAYILPTLLSMAQTPNTSDYEGTKRRVIQEDNERRQIIEQQREQQRQELLRRQQERQAELNQWLRARTEGFLLPGGSKKRKSKKNKKMKHKNKLRQHRSRRRGRTIKSQSKRN